MISHLGPSDSPPIRAVLFDIGGVFFSWPQDSFFVGWEERLGIPAGEFHQHFWHGSDIEAANIGVITAEEYSRRCARRLRVDEAHVRAVIETAFGGEPLNLELVAYAGTLRSRMLVVALTNNWSFGRTMIQRRGINDLFDLIVISAEEGVKKPNTPIFELTLDRLNITPAEAVFIDDTQENVDAAGNLGIHSIQFRSTAQTISDLEAFLARYGSRRE